MLVLWVFVVLVGEYSVELGKAAEMQAKKEGILRARECPIPVPKRFPQPKGNSLAPPTTYTHIQTHGVCMCACCPPHPTLGRSFWVGGRLRQFLAGLSGELHDGTPHALIVP